MNSKISIIIPAFNVEHQIEKCLESVFNQTYQNYEIIIVNDGSTDNTLEIIKKYEKNNSNIKILDITNHGQGYARNLALKQATGEYILFLDADDFIEEITLQVTVDRAERDKPDLVVFDWKYYDEKKETFRYVNIDSFFKKRVLEGNEVLELFKIKHFFTVNKLYSKKFLVNNDIKYEEGYIYEDNPFWVKVVMNAKKVSLVHSPLYNVRISETSTTKTKYNTDKHYKGFIHAINEMINITKQYPENEYSDLYNYIMKKVNLYYRQRVPNKYKLKFINEFIEAMHNAIEPKDLDMRNTLMKMGFKYHIFKDKKVLLFHVIYIMFLCKRYLKRLIRTAKKAMRSNLIKLKARKEGNILIYKKNGGKIQNTVLFMGFDYRYTGNSRYLFEELIKVHEEGVFFVTDDKNVEEKYRVKPQSKEMFNKLYHSKVVIFESWIPNNFKKREDSIWIQLWHGTPLKKMLFDSEEAEITSVKAGHKISKYNDIRKWNYLILDNPNIYQYFRTCYLLPKEKTLNTGYPRVKYLLENKQNLELKRTLREQLGIDENKKIVVYLPTWRDYNYGDDQTKMDFAYFLDIKQLQEKLGEEYKVISKNHVFLNSNQGKEITNVSMETQQLLLIADYLITDYSSVMFDAFAIDLPVILLANDYEKYSNSRGVYEKIWEDLLPFVVYDEKQIPDKIEKYTVESKEYIDAKQKYAYKSEMDLVEFVISKLNKENKEE